MTPSSLASPPPPSWRAAFIASIENISNEPNHPAQIALRTYSLCLSLSLGPALLPAIFAPAVHPKSFRARARVFLRTLFRELRPTGFASVITVAVGGGAALQRFWDWLECRYTHRRTSKIPSYKRAFLANVITSTLAVILLRSWRRHRRPGMPSPTLDLTLFLLTRALDALVQAFLLQKTRETAGRHIQALSRDGVLVSQSFGVPFVPLDTRILDEKSKELATECKNRVATHLDALVFWVSSARLFTLPSKDYVVFLLSTPEIASDLCEMYPNRINSLANVDSRLLEVLCAIREGRWSYIHGSSTKRDILGSLAEELGHPSSWGDPAVLPAYGGELANEAWKRLGVDGRSGIGGLPCELVHGGIGARFGLSNSCTANVAIRAVYAFAATLVIYLPVHFLPVLCTKPDSIVRLRRTIPVFLSAIRSATFLSTFLSSYWLAVCFTRTLVLARLFPEISHDVWDGPYGCTLAGSLACGAGIWIENARRRGEMMLYVLPKALRASIPEKWLHSRHPVVRFTEHLMFVLSLASLLTCSAHQPESLRGLSRWALAFIVKGPNAGSRKKRRGDIATCPPTPMDSSVPPLTDSHYQGDYPPQRYNAQS